MTSGEVVIIITVTASAVVQVIRGFFDAQRSNEIKSSLVEVHAKTNEIKTQTDGNHSELLKKLDILMNENKSLGEKNVTLEKAMIALATKNDSARQVRSSDLINGKGQ